MRNSRKEYEDGWSLKVFTDTLINTNNILMVYYILRFMNELLASFVEDDKLLKFKRELRQNRYEIILDTIKSRIEDRWYRPEYCTFEYVQRRIFEYKERVKNDGSDRELLQIIYSTRKPERQSMLNVPSLISNYTDQDEVAE